MIQTRAHAIELSVRDGHKRSMIGWWIELFYFFKRDDRQIEQARLLRVLALDAEGDNLVGRVVREIFVRQLGSFAVSNNY